MPKRPRYMDVYEQAYECYKRSQTVSGYVEGALRQFRHTPLELLQMPRHLHKMLRTQAIARNIQPEARDVIGWALAVADFVHRRAGRVISHQALRYLYRPGGAWMRGCLDEWARCGVVVA